MEDCTSQGSSGEAELIKGVALTIVMFENKAGSLALEEFYHQLDDPWPAVTHPDSSFREVVGVNGY